MAIGIAGDNPTTIPGATLTTSQSLDLLTQLLIELRTLTTVTANGLNSAEDLTRVRMDQDIAIVTGVDL